MKRAITTLGVLGLTALAVAAPAVADRGSDDDDRIVICHAGSGSNSSQYSPITVAVPSLNGHDGHGADIIPPNDGMDYGQNWDALGRAIHAGGCVTPGTLVPPVHPPVVVNPPVVPPVVVNPPVVPPVVVPPIAVPPVVVPPAVVNPPVVPPVVDQPVIPPAVVVPPVEVPPVEQPVVTPITNPQIVEQPAAVPPATVPPATTVVVPEQPAAVQSEATVSQAAAAAPTTGAATSTGRGTNQGYNAQTAVGGPDAEPSWLAGLGALLTAGTAVAFRRKPRTLPLTR